MSTTLIHACRLSALAILVATTAMGQSPNRRPASNIEQDARESWQPVRDLSRRKPTQRPEPAPLKLVQHAAPMPPSSMPMSVVSPNASAPSASIPLDGRVVLEPLHGSGYDMTYDAGCDSLPGGACGCGDGGCDGLCAGPACGPCSGIGCSSGACCNGDPMCGQYRDCDALQPCITLCWPQDGWFSAEYLMWWQDGMHTPPLASDGPIGPGNTGNVLFGGEDLLTDQFDGFRFDFGFWLDNCHTWGIGADYFRIGTETDSFFGTNASHPALDRPFQNLGNNGAEDTELVNEAGILSGNLSIDADSELQGWGIHLRHLRCAQTGCVTDLCCTPQQYCSRTEYLVGFRQVQLGEGIRIREDLTANPQVGTEDFDIVDQFRTRNQFNGIDLGILYSRVRGYWNFDAGLRLGVGNTRQRVRINGTTTITGTGGTDAEGVPQLGGLLAQLSNIGSYSRDEFSILPQLDLKLGYQLTDQLRATFGYTFLYWSNVVRPGDHIDRLIDTAQIPTAPITNPPVVGTFPEFAFNNTDYWAQGISFGGEYRW